MNNKFMNTIMKIIVIVAMIVGAIFIALIFAKPSQAINQKEKIDKEVIYLDTKILMLINSLNNINLQNYQVSMSKIEEKNSSNEEQGGSSSGNKESMGGMEEEASNESSKTTGTEKSNNEEKITVTKMELEGGNSGNSEPNWKNMQSEVEMLLQAWSTIILDLYKTDSNKDDILNFSTTLDDVIVNLNKKDKTMSAMYMAKLYSYLPKFLGEKPNDKVLKTVIETKSHIINAYAYIETDNWDKVGEETNSASGVYAELMNDVDLAKDQRKYGINKSYVLLEEFKNSLGTKNKDVFYMKYKNIIEGLDWIE